MGAAVAAIIVAKERQIVDAFRDVGATSVVTALPLDQVGVDENVGFRRLRMHEVIRESAPGRFYLDEGVWTAVRNTRRRLALILALIAVLLVAFLAVPIVEIMLGIVSR